MVMFTSTAIFNVFNKHLMRSLFPSNSARIAGRRLLDGGGSGFSINVQFLTKCAVLEKLCAVLITEQCNPKAYCLVVHRCKEVNRSKNGRFRYEMIGKTQL